MPVRTPDLVRPAETVELHLGLDFPILAAAYCRWRAEGLFPLIFHRCPDINLREWLDWNYSPSVEPVGVYHNEQLVGVGWIQAHLARDGGQAIEAGAAFFQGTPLSIWRRGLDLLVRHAFEDRGFAEIFGVSWIHNRAARHFIGRCAMDIIRELPWDEDVTDCICTRLTREEWQHDIR